MIEYDNNDDDDKDDDDNCDDGVYLKAVNCEFRNLQIIWIICKCEVMMWWCAYRFTENRNAVNMRIMMMVMMMMMIDDDDDEDDEVWLTPPPPQKSSSFGLIHQSQ